VESLGIVNIMMILHYLIWTLASAVS